MDFQELWPVQAWAVQAWPVQVWSLSLDLVAMLHLYRFSISWTRVLPEHGHGEPVDIGEKGKGLQYRCS